LVGANLVPPEFDPKMGIGGIDGVCQRLTPIGLRKSGRDGAT
jgi:hypothetical protein